MKKRGLSSALLVILSALSLAGCGTKIFNSSHGAVLQEPLISQEMAKKTALAKVGGEEVIGIRFDKPDAQWDVFVRVGTQGYEVEVNALTGEVVSAEPESLEEINAELSGDLSHEGVSDDVD